MKNTFLILYLGVVFNFCIGQNSEKDYLLALISIQNNNGLQDDIKATFGKEAFNKKRSLSISLDESIEFIDIGYLMYDQLHLVEMSGLESDLLIDRRRFKSLYYFEPISMHSFSGILPESSILKVLFSKRFGNVLTAEISYSENKLGNSRIRFGKRLIVLFFFNEKGRITHIISKEITHN